MIDNAAAQAASEIKELTLRGIVLGALLTVLFTAANVYLGLKIGITFATSIPAAVISMAILKAFSDTQHQGEQHRPDDRLGGGDAVGDHLRPARPDHGRLVDRLSLLAERRGDRHRRHLGRDVFGAAAARARDRKRPALPRRRRRGRSAQGRRRRRRGRGKSPRPARDRHVEPGCGRLFRRRQDAPGGRSRRA